VAPRGRELCDRAADTPVTTSNNDGQHTRDDSCFQRLSLERFSTTG
jgi:hypothetical protein